MHKDRSLFFCVIFPQRKRKKLLQTRLILPMGKAGTRFHRLFEGGAPGMVRPQRCFHHIQHRYPPRLPLQDRFSQGYPWRLSWVMSLQMPSLIGSYLEDSDQCSVLGRAGGGHEENPQSRLKSRAHGFSEDGAGGGGRTHTVSLPTDFESVMSAIPSHRRGCLLSIIHFREKIKEKVQAGWRLRHDGKIRCYPGGQWGTGW